MRRTRIKTILFLTVMISLISQSSLFAQRNFERHEFSFHAGYGNMFNETPTLTLTTHDYERKLAQGVSWDAQYLFRPLKRFVFGVIYSGFSSKGSHEEGSDHLWTNMIATQIGLSNADTKRWQIRGGIGPGLVYFRNNSESMEHRHSDKQQRHLQNYSPLGARNRFPISGKRTVQNKSSLS